LKKYVTERESLRVVFHLVDSRHGLLDADEDCLSLLPDLPEHVQYVIVFTKVDKRSGGVRRDILERLNKEIKERTDRPIPVLYSSSETREGGAEIWSVLLDSLASEPSGNLYDRQKALPPDEE
jgi:GTP-binding protein EngB required for normal cell division